MGEISTVDDMIIKKVNSPENQYQKCTGRLNWGYTDVLYSFLGVYVLGVNVLHKDKVKCCGIQIKPVKGSSRQIAYSGNFIRTTYEDYKELNNLSELSDFIKAYFKIGNVIPIWPGGNEHKGKSQCYDIPDIYFNKVIVKGYANNFYNTFLKDKNFFLDDILDGEYSTKTIEKYLAFDESEYAKFLKHIVAVIDKRSELITKWAKENVVC